MRALPFFPPLRCRVSTRCKDELWPGWLDPIGTVGSNGSSLLPNGPTSSGPNGRFRLRDTHSRRSKSSSTRDKETKRSSAIETDSGSPFGRRPTRLPSRRRPRKGQSQSSIPMVAFSPQAYPVSFRLGMRIRGSCFGGRSRESVSVSLMPTGGHPILLWFWGTGS